MIGLSTDVEMFLHRFVGKVSGFTQKISCKHNFSQENPLFVAFSYELSTISTGNCQQVVDLWITCERRCEQKGFNPCSDTPFGKNLCIEQSGKEMFKNVKEPLMHCTFALDMVRCHLNCKDFAWQTNRDWR